MAPSQFAPPKQMRIPGSSARTRAAMASEAQFCANVVEKPIIRGFIATSAAAASATNSVASRRPVRYPVELVLRGVLREPREVGLVERRIAIRIQRLREHPLAGEEDGGEAFRNELVELHAGALGEGKIQIADGGRHPFATSAACKVLTPKAGRSTVEQGAMTRTTAAVKGVLQSQLLVCRNRAIVSVTVGGGT